MSEGPEEEGEEIPWLVTGKENGTRKYPNKASREFIKLINSAMENARQRFDTIDPEDMTSHI